MAAEVYTVLYTHQKTKKVKVWQDGVLKTSGGQQAVLYSDKGQRLENVYLKTGKTNPGDELESDRYLITVEAAGDGTSFTKSNTEHGDVQNFSRIAPKPMGLRPPAGLKRKFTGFQGPREVTKKPSLEVEETTALPSPQLPHGSSSHSPLLYAASPLFAASYGKIADKDKRTNVFSKQTTETFTNPDVRETIFDTNFLADSVHKVEEERTKQNPRSTAQILALLNTLPSQKASGAATAYSPEVQRTTSTNRTLESQPYVLPTKGCKPLKSRWDVYIENTPASSTAPNDHAEDVVPLSPGIKLDISHTTSLMDNDARQEKVRTLNRELDIEGNKQLSDSYISEPDLSNSQSLPPDSSAVIADDCIRDYEDHDGTFSEITFNLMDSFDFTELDDAESLQEGISDSTKNEQQDCQLKNGQEKNEHTNNSSLQENITDWDIAAISDTSCINAKSEMTAQGQCDRDNKAEVSPNSSQSGSRHSPPRFNVQSMQNSPARWIVGTPGSDCDWELTQLSSSKSSKVKTPTQNSSSNIRPFFLRPRQGNVAEDSAIQLCDSLASLEQNNLLDSAKISKVQSRLMKELTVTSVAENDMDDAPCDTPKALKPSAFLLRNGRSAVSPEVRSSKWAVYQSPSEGSQDVNKENSEFCPQSVFRSQNKTDEILNSDMEPTTSSHDKFVSSGSRDQILAKIRTPSTHFLPFVGKNSRPSKDTGDKQILLSCELGFPCRQTVLSSSVPKRKVKIPTLFKSAAHYKQVFGACLAEHLNIIMYELSQRLHKAFSKVDMSFYTSSGDETNRKDSAAPLCLHQQRAKLVMVRKEGPNQGRFFYACDAPKASQCNFFKWLNEVKGTHTERDTQETRVVMSDMKSLSSYVRCQNINLYEESQLIIRKMTTFPVRQYGKFPKFANVDSEFGGESKTKLYLKLSRKNSSSAYSKDDLWVVSKTLNFDPLDTFIACSVFFGPSANNDIEISPLKGYSPSNWPSNVVVHALLVCNASTELTSLRNMHEHFNPSLLPIMPHLLTMSSQSEEPIKIPRGKFKPPAITAKVSSKCTIADHTFVLTLAKEMITQFCLNGDQATALLQIARMMADSDGIQGPQAAPITVIHGVFGAGKSYLLAVVVLFLVQLFEAYNPPEEHCSFHWKLLISSSTNVAVDRVLLGLLDLGFDQFIRVGSIRKIAKPILPHSLHAGSENESEQLKELLALLKQDLTPGEKAYVRKSIELHKVGTNKTLLGQVRVVGATCAACPFPCLSNLKFPVVILDECSQITEPASLLPIARFQCEKLILVGDPKQLSPTIQGSEAAHEFGLEQTLFDRLCLMGHQAVMLRTQYRCHPSISALANELFYEGNLVNGVSEDDRKPLLAWLPTLCFYNANGTELVEGNNSFYNVEEANFTVKLIQSLIASGIEGSMIGVITLYKAQMNKVCCMLSSAAVNDPSNMKAIQVSTVDAFQGAEKEIIILSCVRTRQVGFIDSEKRMNVALTRGKRHLLIVGSLACLRKNKLWEQVIHHCERHKDGLNHLGQWDERLNAILALYQQKKEEEAESSTQKKKY
ncbi:5'-3' DNA helicase ZGRF1 isoform X5 [Dendropsophus ebraccatus]|uniref:5'-3' DNA helicase ZGRF1 isoform X5 n=1 Tax=Dendropsophus ebraccatus TaxID=150705 RepID=UPI003831F56A